MGDPRCWSELAGGWFDDAARNDLTAPKHLAVCGSRVGSRPTSRNVWPPDAYRRYVRHDAAVTASVPRPRCWSRGIGSGCRARLSGRQSCSRWRVFALATGFDWERLPRYWRYLAPKEHSETQNKRQPPTYSFRIQNRDYGPHIFLS
jgi:hypothetical protein